MADKTYYYRTDVGEQKDLVVIAVSFKNALTIENKTMATVNGLWQISDLPIDPKVDREYDKMRIASTSENSIYYGQQDNTMDNKIILWITR